MKINDCIKVFKFGIEEVWKTFFKNVWEPYRILLRED